MTDTEVPVLIVGSGPAGLSAAVLLADLGVRTLVVERNPSTTDHPRAHVVNTRTMEIFRQIGIADAVVAAGIPPAAYARVLWKRTIAGEELGALEIGEARSAERASVSPTRIASCAQDNVEALLRQAAERRGCALRYATELVGYEPDADGVTATLRTDGVAARVRAQYVIAADGASSPTRRLLDVAMVGIPPLATLVGIYFHADLAPWVQSRPALLYFLMNSRALGIVIPLDGRRRWIYHWLQAEEGLGAEAAAAAVRLAVGVEDLAVEIKGIRPWTMTAEVAERFRVGRVFLAGDAAHRFPPTGGFGLNTGVQDAHNLAWKLALVLAGRASEALLATYEAERRPVAQSNTDWSVRNFAEGGTAVGSGNVMATMQLEAGGPDVPRVLAQLQADIDGERDHFDALGQDLGFVYEAGALIPDGTSLPAVGDRAAEYVPNARPGSRAPHVWLERGGARVSSLDLFGTGFVLLVPAAARAWSAAVADSALPVAVTLRRIGPGGDLDDPTGTWARLYDVGADGAVLVRPDGHVAWRVAVCPPDPRASLRAALATILAPTLRRQG
jgi:2-polyprenyl-6-methoxyphenol hydroxylase-like FAD-dependent oxidoreductase